MSSMEDSPGLDPAMERLAQHIQEGGGADYRSLGERMLEWSEEVAPFLATEDVDTEADTLEMQTIPGWEGMGLSQGREWENMHAGHDWEGFPEGEWGEAPIK